METDWAPICDRYLNMQPEVGLVCRRREVKATSTPNGGLESMDPHGTAPGQLVDTLAVQSDSYYHFTRVREYSSQGGKE